MIGYPLLLAPRYDQKIWGGRRLETVLGKALPCAGPFGESLESGDEAVVENGPLAGCSLRDLVQRDPTALLGDRGLVASQPFNNFPLLVKFIDASDILSLQLHPNDAGAAPLGKRGKTESWHIVQADPGSSLITGMSCSATSDEMRTSIQDSTFETLLERRTVSAGDSLIVPAGTMHAIGAGVLLYEVQQNSDVTFRLYDWGRVDSEGQPRELHLEQALEALRPERHALVTQPLARDDWREILTACCYFALERWRISGSRSLAGTGGTFRLLSCIDGALRIEVDRKIVGELSLGQTVLFPADLPPVTLHGAATLLVSSIPDLAEDVVRPLLAAGHARESIALLGGHTSELVAALAAL